MAMATLLPVQNSSFLNSTHTNLSLAIPTNETETFGDYSFNNLTSTLNDSSNATESWESWDNPDELRRIYIAYMAGISQSRWEDKFNVIFWTGIIPVVAVLGFVGSLIVLLVATLSDKFRTCSCIYLTNLAAIDVFQCLVMVPARFLEIFAIKFPFSDEGICKFTYLMRDALYICYMQTFVLIAIERFIVVTYPMKAVQICTKKHARLSLLGIWCLSLILAIPSVFQMSLVGANYGWPICANEIIQSNYPGVDIRLWRKLHESYQLFILYVLPLIVLIVCYTIIAFALRRSIKAAQQMTACANLQSHDGSVNERLRPRRKIVPDVQRERLLVLRMCIVLVTFFAICQGPSRIQYWLNVVWGNIIPMEINMKLSSPFYLLIVLNSAVNPIVYGFMSKNFRQAFILSAAKMCLVPIKIYRVGLQQLRNKRINGHKSDIFTIDRHSTSLTPPKKYPPVIRLSDHSGESLPDLQAVNCASGPTSKGSTMNTSPSLDQSSEADDHSTTLTSAAAPATSHD